LNGYLATHSIIGIDKQFVSDGGNSYWAFSVTTVKTNAKPHIGQFNKKRTSVDYREVLSPEHFAIYARLRELRNKLADQQGVPSYSIFTNEQLANIARLEVADRSTFAAIEGIGEKRMELYAETFLDALNHAE